MSYVVLARKYRPMRFADMVGQEHIGRTLGNAIKQDRVHHAYLFSGARGLGKTTTARIFAKGLVCQHGPTPDPCNECSECVAVSESRSVDVMEIDGASNNSVDDIRNLREQVNYLPQSARRKVYIIDEVHMLSTSAFNALLKTLEEPPPHVNFVFATTEPQKVLPTILSRVNRLDFKRVSPGELVAYLRTILDREGLSVEDGGLRIVARAGEGSVRDALTLLDQVIAFAEDSKNISEDEVRRLLGQADAGALLELLDAILEGDPTTTMKRFEALVTAGNDLGVVSLQVLELLRDLTVLRVCGTADVLPDATEAEIAQLRALGDKVEPSHLGQLFDRFSRVIDRLPQSRSQRLLVEMGLLELACAEPVMPLGDLVDQLHALGRGAPLPSGGGGGGGRGGGAPRAAGGSARGRGGAVSPGRRAQAHEGPGGFTPPEPPPFEERGPSRGFAPEPPPFEERGPSRGLAPEPPPFEERGPSRGFAPEPPPFEDAAPPRGRAPHEPASRGFAPEPPPFEDAAPSRGFAPEPPPFEDAASPHDEPPPNQRIAERPSFEPPYEPSYEPPPYEQPSAAAPSASSTPSAAASSTPSSSAVAPAPSPAVAPAPSPRTPEPEASPFMAKLFDMGLQSGVVIDEPPAERRPPSTPPAPGPASSKPRAPAAVGSGQAAAPGSDAVRMGPGPCLPQPPADGLIAWEELSSIEAWEQLVGRIRESDDFLAAVLSQVGLVQLADGVVRVAAPRGDFSHTELTRNPQRRAQIEQACRDHLGAPFTVELIEGSPELPDLPSLDLVIKQRRKEHRERVEAEAKAHPGIQALLRTFDAQLLAIKPLQEP